MVARHGRLDILMNNAGIFRPAQMLNTSTEMWNQTVAINQTGVFFGMRTVARAIKQLAMFMYSFIILLSHPRRDLDALVQHCGLARRAAEALTATDATRLPHYPLQ